MVKIRLPHSNHGSCEHALELNQHVCSSESASRMQNSFYESDATEKPIDTVVLEGDPWYFLGFSPATCNLFLLSVGFGIGWAMLFVQVSSTTVAAQQWVGTAFAAVPYGLLATFHAASALPAQLLLRVWGERRSYILGGLFGAAGNALCVWAAHEKSALLLCLGAPLCGIANAYANFLRFEPAKFVHPDRAALAVAVVVAGGVLGGGAGPILSRFTRHLTTHEFQGTYLLCVVLWLLEAGAVLAVQFDNRVKQREAETEGAATSRSLWEIVRDVRYALAVLCGAVSYTAMAASMLVVILAMKSVQEVTKVVDFGSQTKVYGFDDIANVVLVHVEAMFVPSFFTGYFINIVGASVVITIGFVLHSLGTFLLLIGTQLWVFFLCLTLIGVGWNFSYVGATTLVSCGYRGKERQKAQGFNDLFIFTINAIVSTTAGLLAQTLNSWHIVIGIFGSVLILGVLLGALLWRFSRNSIINLKLTPVPDHDKQ